MRIKKSINSEKKIDSDKIVQNIFFLLSLAICLFLRTVWLDEVPPGLANDEANIILNAQSLLHTGKNIPGVVTGVLGHPTGRFDGGIHSELSSFLLTPFYVVTGLSLSTVKLPFALASFGSVVFIYLITAKLFNKTTANIALVLAVINPWLIHFGRAGYESIFSAFFYLGAVFVFLATKKWKIFYALPFLLIGFLCYFSAKVLLFPLSFSFLLYEILLKKKESFKQVLYLNFVVIMFITAYFLTLKGSIPGRRIFELGGKSYAGVVDDNRTHSINFPLQTVVENKYLESVNYRLKASLGIVSAPFLFLNGQPESSGHLTVPDHGPLYPVDLLMVFVGFLYLARNYLKKMIFLSFLIAATFLPNFLDIQNTTYSMRPVILIPILIIITASGVNAILSSITGKKITWMMVGAIVLIYLFLFLRFIFQYFFRMPIINNDAWFFQDRVATHYIQSLQKIDPERKVVWVTPFVHHTFYRYIFFGGLYTSSQNIKEINNLLRSEVYTIGNVSVQESCPQSYDKSSGFYLIDATLNCEIPETRAIIANVDDAGVKYRLINDPLCREFLHNRYPLIKYHRLLNIGNLSNEEFCVNYVSNNQE